MSVSIPQFIPPPPPYLLETISLFSTSMTLLLFSKKARLYPLVLLYGKKIICLLILFEFLHLFLKLGDKIVTSFVLKVCSCVGMSIS